MKKPHPIYFTVYMKGNSGMIGARGVVSLAKLEAPDFDKFENGT